jgi:tRNA nucleotidyltransferase (CCA-adding enzyme)
MAKSDSKRQRGEQSGKTSHEVVVTTHINADFDALSSMIAAGKLYPDAALVFPGAQEKNLRNFFLHSTSYLFNFTKLKRIDFDRIRKLILVDTRQKSRIGKFARLVGREGVEIHIYDHHPDSDDDVQGHVEVVRKIGSTTALLTAILREKRIAVSADEATIMCLGIHEDTGSFTFSSTTAEDYEAAAWLTEQGADHNVISDMLTRELTAEQVWLLNDLTQAASTRVINGIPVVLTKVIRDEYIGDFAVLVHKFMEMENLDVVFALAQMEDRIYLVARSRTEEVNAGEIALALGGGGHPQAASATIKNKTLAQVERSIQALLRSRTNPVKTAAEIMSSPVIHIPPRASVKEAADLMTRYNINVLLVMEDEGPLQGVITRQIVEKAVFFSLGDVKVQEYMNIEFSTVRPDASLEAVKDIIVKERARILPVVEESGVRGVITRTDLLSVLVGESPTPEPLYEPRHASHYIRKKNMSAMLKERLPRKIINRLKNLGQVADMLGYNAYLVGGLVRDVLLKRENLDVDVVIEGDGIKFAREFVKHYSARMRSHQKFGTAVLIFPDGFKADVATARMEYYEAPGAPPIVETSSLKMDLYRRDFTINTLAIKLNQRHYGTLIDYFGAQKDIKEKSLRVLHNLSFVEDPTRMLRAVRFEQRFGFRIGKLTLALMKNALKIHSFQDLAGRRFFTELKLILKQKDPIQAIERMDELGILRFISPSLQLTDRTRTLLEEIRRVIAWYNLLYLGEPFEPWKVYWHGLTDDVDPKTLTALAELMGMTDAPGRRLLSQNEAANSLLDALFKFEQDNHTLYTLLTPYDTETLLFTMARATREKIRRLISLYFTKLKQTTIQTSGKDLLEMGFQPGPLFKEIFDRVLAGRLNDRLRTKEDEIAFVKKHFLSGERDRARS